jgi:hypothetical protein
MIAVPHTRLRYFCSPQCAAVASERPLLGRIDPVHWNKFYLRRVAEMLGEDED